MKIVFVSNYMSIHQLPFCIEMINLVGDGNFYFISVSGFDKYRKSVGYENLDNKYDFIIRAYESHELKMKSISIVTDCDVALINPVYDEYSLLRKRANKLTFFVCERLLKRGLWYKYFPPKYIRTYKKILRFKSKNFYILCCGAYVSYDFITMGYPRDRFFKWGYFPAVFNFNNKIKREKNSILWVGRFIKWKKIDILIKAAKLLLDEKVEFHINIVGAGAEFKNIKKMIYSCNLENNITFLGGCSNDDVRKLMERTEVVVATSDRNEGWGAVINEAMSSGCAVVASNAMGATPFLINNNVNGVCFKCGDFRDLANKLKKVLLVDDYRIEIQNNAVKCITCQWNPRIASERLLELIENINTGDKYKTAPSGPCSIARIIKY